MRFNKEQFEYMKQRRGLDFIERNMRVQVDGKEGKVIGNYGDNLLVKFEGNTRSSNCHPHWRVIYFSNDGKIIKSFGE
jgi:hypothetical protein